MAKNLILYRHAKSDWEADYDNDHERPLAARGIDAARKMGSLLKESEQLPNFIVCSTAVRALQTLEFSAKAGNWASDIQTHGDLYTGGSESILNIIHSTPKNVSRLMLISHEPKLSILSSKLIGGGEIRFPTAGMCRIDFKVSKWSDIQFEGGELRWMLQPVFFKR